jgi:hypothetical protein
LIRSISAANSEVYFLFILLKIKSSPLCRGCEMAAGKAQTRPYRSDHFRFLRLQRTQPDPQGDPPPMSFNNMEIHPLWRSVRTSPGESQLIRPLCILVSKRPERGNAA